MRSCVVWTFIFLLGTSSLGWCMHHDDNEGEASPTISAAMLSDADKPPNYSALGLDDVGAEPPLYRPRGNIDVEQGDAPGALPPSSTYPAKSKQSKLVQCGGVIISFGLGAVLYQLIALVRSHI